MRRLSIATAHAFLIVYSITSAESFSTAKCCLEEIREQRADWQEIPTVVAGNKLDLAVTKREVRVEDVSEWLFCSLPKLRYTLDVVEDVESYMYTIYFGVIVNYGQENISCFLSYRWKTSVFLYRVECQRCVKCLGRKWLRFL